MNIKVLNLMFLLKVIEATPLDAICAVEGEAVTIVGEKWKKSTKITNLICSEVVGVLKARQISHGISVVVEAEEVGTGHYRLR